MARTLLILCLAAASLAAKNRDWQNGQLLDKNSNPYFRAVPASNKGGGVAASSNASFVAGDNGVLAVNSRAAEGDISYENYVIQGADTVYMVEYAHFKTFPTPNVLTGRPASYVVEKNKLIILDLDRHEFETTILKQVARNGSAVASAATPAASPAAANEPAKKKEEAKVEQPKPDKPKAQSSKPDNLFARAALSNDDLNPSKPKPAPAPAQAAAPAVAADKPAVQTQPPAPAPKPEPKVEASVTKPVQKPEPKVEAPIVKPAPKPEPKAEAAVTKPAPKPEARPEGPVVRASTKDRAWQSGQLLSVANNNYFFNVTYTSDVEGSSWPFSQGSDGRLTVTGQIAANTNSPYTYDNYVIESEYVAYLVQRMRPKTSPAVRLPGTKPLKFAVDKGKMWVVDDQGVEYETKVVKLIQKDAIVDPLARTAAR